MPFVKATKQQAKGRVALIGVSGSGKTMTSLTWARTLAGPKGRIAVIDTEAGSASKYADEFEFDTLILESFTPRSYIAAIHEAEAAGYDVLVIDSLSHAWAGKDGILAMVDNATARSKSGNAFTSGWREATPEHNNLVDALVRCSVNLIVTMRAKTEYVIDEANGKKFPKKVGMAPVQRDGLEYEFDLVGDMDTEHTLIVTKSRCRQLADKVFRKPDQQPAEVLRDWLTSGAPAPQKNKSDDGPDIERATAAQVKELTDLMEQVKLPHGVTDKWLERAGCVMWDEMSSEHINRCIEYLRARTPKDGDVPPKTTPQAKPEKGKQQADYLKWYDHMESIAASVECPPAIFEQGIEKCIKGAKLTGKPWESTPAQREQWEKALRDKAGFFAVPDGVAA